MAFILPFLWLVAASCSTLSLSLSLSLSGHRPSFDGCLFGGKKKIFPFFFSRPRVFFSVSQLDREGRGEAVKCVVAMAEGEKLPVCVAGPALLRISSFFCLLRKKMREDFVRLSLVVKLRWKNGSFFRSLSLSFPREIEEEQWVGKYTQKRTTSPFFAGNDNLMKSFL